MISGLNEEQMIYRDRLTSALFARASIFVKENCGIGSDGFEAGNKCASKDGGFGSGEPTSVNKRGEQFHAVKRGADKIWKDPAGNAVPKHIQKIAIPPKWKNVEVNADPKGTVLVRGRDEKGRTQSRYSESHNAKKAAKKFMRTRELITKRAQIFGEIKADAKSGEHREAAECLHLVMKTGLRPGSDDKSLADHESFGATTLEGRHIIPQKDGTVILRLVTGKNKGREKDFPVSDKATAKMLIRRKKEAGDDGKVFDVSAAKLREYSSTKDGGGFRTKDHRTALGTETAIKEVKGMKPPKTEAEYKAGLKFVAESVARVLGNTPAIALKSYIDPHVFSAWNRGKK